MVGKTVGKYRIVTRLGRGGMGTVYKAVDETLDREVAIKVLNPDLVEGEGMKRFRAEAMTLARLNHPNIATLYELSREGDDLLMVMEYVSGDTLEKLVERDGALALGQAVSLALQVLDALEHAHRAGVIHRDLKPANLMIAASNTVKVMDFGIARVLGSEHLTSDGFMMGTPAYMAPEQVRGEDVDARTDLYAVAVVLYRLITGRLPFKADTAVAMIQSQLSAAPTPLRQFRAEVPAWLDQVMNQALAKAPADRFQSASDMRAALEQGLSGGAPFSKAPARPADEFAATLPPTPTPVATPVMTATAATPPAPATSVRSADAPRTAQPSGEPAPGEATVTLRKPQLAMAGALVAVLVLAVGILAFLALRKPAQEPAPVAVTTPASPEPTPAVVPPAPSTAAESAPPLAPAGAQPAPRSAGAAPVTAPAPAPSPARPAPPTATTRPTAPSTAAPNPPTAAPTPAPAPVDAAKATPAAAPAAPARAPADAKLPPLSFADVKALVDEDAKPVERDVSLHLEDGQVIVRAEKGNAVIKQMAYPSVTNVTYSQSREPRWKEGFGVGPRWKSLSAPMFFVKTTRHWLTLQQKDDFVILRLDKNHVNVVLLALETRLGLKVQRLEGDK